MTENDTVVVLQDVLDEMNDTLSSLLRAYNFGELSTHELVEHSAEAVAKAHGEFTSDKPMGVTAPTACQPWVHNGEVTNEHD